MVNNSGKPGGRLYRLLVSVGIICLAVVVANILFGAPPVIAIVFGGGAGFLIVRFALSSLHMNENDRDNYSDGPITGPKRFALGFVALCGFYFLVGLAFVESLCCAGALVLFFTAAERYSRTRDTNGLS